VQRGHPADFPVTLKPLYYSTGEGNAAACVPNRLAVVRGDTDRAISVVSDRYQLVPHQQLLNIVDSATTYLDVGPVPRGIYVDRGGARMRALFKFPSLARPISKDDDVCPCIKIQNTYDTTSRIMVHIGAFRFVCTILAVGGGGIFAGGFMAVHSGEIPVEKIAEQLGSYLSNFDSIAETYRRWTKQRFDRDQLDTVIQVLPKRAGQVIEQGIRRSQVESVYAAYNIATNYATHRRRSVRTAFDLLERINRTFQQQFPAAN
jgi:hypothetical protein